MLLEELIEIMEDWAPVETQEEWDNSGLQIGSKADNIEAIVLALDLEEVYLDLAIEKGANLVITHHPMIFGGISSIDYQTPMGKMIKKAVENGINIYAAHTNLDKALGGVNDALAQSLDYSLENNLEDEEFSIGRWGNIHEISLGDLAKKAKERLGASLVVAYGDLDRKVEKLAVVGGSGASFIPQALALGIDCIITGDVKHHEARDALAQGIGILDVGHYHSEIPVLDKIKEKLEASKVNLPIFIEDLGDDRHKF